MDNKLKELCELCQPIINYFDYIVDDEDGFLEDDILIGNSEMFITFKEILDLKTKVQEIKNGKY